MPPRLVAVLVLVLGLTAVACSKKKDEPKGDTKTTPTAGDTTKVDPGAKPADKPGQAQGDLALLPVDSEAVIGVNWAQLGQSPIWKTLIEPQMQSDNDFMANIEKFKTRCGFDPLASVQQMAVGMKGLGGDKPDGVLVLHGLDKAKTLACADKWQAEAEREKLTIKKDGDVIIVSGDDGAAAFSFLGDDRLLVVVGSQATADGIKKVAQGGSALSTSPAFVDMYGKINKSSSVWFLANGNSKIFEEASALGLRPKAVFGSVDVTDGVSAEVRARLDSADQATQTANSFRGQIQAMSGMFDKLDLATDGADLKLTAAASTAKLQALFKMLGGGGGGDEDDGGGM